MSGYMEVLAYATVDGPTLTTAAALSCIPPASVIQLRPNFFSFVGQQVLIKAMGRISCVVTTPGTARFDLRLTNPTPTTVIAADSLAMSLNIVAKTAVPWELEMLLTCRAIGATGNLHMQGHWLSEAALNTAVPTTGPGPGGFNLPFNAAPAVGANFDTTKSQNVDLFYTQTVGTAGTQLILHQYTFIDMNSAR